MQQNICHVQIYTSSPTVIKFQHFEWCWYFCPAKYRGLSQIKRNKLCVFPAIFEYSSKVVGISKLFLPSMVAIIMTLHVNSFLCYKWINKKRNQCHHDYKYVAITKKARTTIWCKTTWCHATWYNNIFPHCMRKTLPLLDSMCAVLVKYQQWFSSLIMIFYV